jgi:putative ABC transport system substrate-binding protein
MRRRDFVKSIGALAVDWPNAIQAQGQIRRVGVLMNLAADDPDAMARLTSFRQGLEQLGWAEGRNVQFDIRYGNSQPDLYRALAKHLVTAKPEVILAHSTPMVEALERETRAIPIVFVSVSDPVGSSFVDSMARPGGNATGFMLYEAGIAGKWLAMLKEIAPQIKRAALVADPKTTPFDYYLRSAKATAPSLGIDVVPTPVSGPDIEHAIGAFAQIPNGGLVILPSATLTARKDLVVALATRHRLPAVYPLRGFVAAGGLMAYSTDVADLNRQAASYVDRILRGARPSELPVQAPTKYETTLNLKTAKVLGLAVPSSLLVRADEVAE